MLDAPFPKKEGGICTQAILKGLCLFRRRRYFVLQWGAYGDLPPLCAAELFELSPCLRQQSSNFRTLISFLSVKTLVFFHTNIKVF